MKKKDKQTRKVVPMPTPTKQPEKAIAQNPIKASEAEVQRLRSEIETVSAEIRTRQKAIEGFANKRIEEFKAKVVKKGQARLDAVVGPLQRKLSELHNLGRLAEIRLEAAYLINAMSGSQVVMAADLDLDPEDLSFDEDDLSFDEDEDEDEDQNVPDPS